MAVPVVRRAAGGGGGFGGFRLRVSLRVVQEVRVHLQRLLDGEGVDAEHAVEVDDGVGGLDHLRDGVDGLDRVHDLRELRLGHEIDLVEQDAVSKGHLLDGFVDGAVRLLLLKVDADVLGVRQAQDGVDAVGVRDLGVDEERERDGRGVGEAGGLDDDVVEILRAVLEREQRAHQVAAHGAAHAPVVHGDDVLLFLHVLAHERIVDGHRAELILDDGDELAVIALKDVVHQRGLARAEETGDDGHGGFLRFRNVRHGQS